MVYHNTIHDKCPFAWINKIQSTVTWNTQMIGSTQCDANLNKQCKIVKEIMFPRTNNSCNSQTMCSIGSLTHAYNPMHHYMIYP